MMTRAEGTAKSAMYFADDDVLTAHHRADLPATKLLPERFLRWGSERTAWPEPELR